MKHRILSLLTMMLFVVGGAWAETGKVKVTKDGTVSWVDIPFTIVDGTNISVEGGYWTPCIAGSTTGDLDLREIWSGEGTGTQYALTSIGQYAFCYLNVTSIRVPASVTSIHQQAFTSASNCADAYFYGETPAEMTPYMGWFKQKALTTIHCPQGKKAAYEAKFSGWTVVDDIVAEAEPVEVNLKPYVKNSKQYVAEFTMPTDAGVEIEVEYEAIDPAITVTLREDATEAAWTVKNGTTDITSDLRVELIDLKDAELTLAITGLPEGQRINPEAFTTTPAGVAMTRVEGNTYKFTMPATTLAITAELEAIPLAVYDIVATGDTDGAPDTEEGTISMKAKNAEGTADVVVVKGETEAEQVSGTLTLTIKPKAGYRVKKVTAEKAEPVTVAPGVALSEATVGMIVCQNGMAYTTAEYTEACGTKVGIIGYKNGTSGYVIALVNATNQSWNEITNNGANKNTNCPVAADKLGDVPAAPEGNTWVVATMDVYAKIFDACGSTTNDSEGQGKVYDATSNAKITDAGGTAISGVVWTTTVHPEYSEYGYCVESGNWNAYDSTSNRYVRPVFAF